MTQAQEGNGRMLDVAPAQAQAPAGQGALLLHRVYLVGFKSKITTVISWTVTSLSARRDQLTITEQRAYAHQNRTAAGHLGAVAQSGRSSVTTSWKPRMRSSCRRMTAGIAKDGGSHACQRFDASAGGGRAARAAAGPRTDGPLRVSTSCWRASGWRQATKVLLRP